MVFRNLIENEKNPENVTKQMDLKNAFNSLKGDKMLETVFPEATTDLQLHALCI